MNEPDKQYVYHGSGELFDSVVPKRQRRSRIEVDGTRTIIFDDISFHATPYRWIALAYTFNPKGYQIDGRTAHYNMGVSLYEHTEELDIYGFDSLEESLEKMYEDGGYLFIFEKDKFFHTEGLGDLEVITKDNLKPYKIEKINNPVDELRELGIRFNFIDLDLPENEGYRNYSIN